jgi:hypothetical protein
VEDSPARNLSWLEAEVEHRRHELARVRRRRQLGDVHGKDERVVVVARPEPGAVRRARLQVARVERDELVRVDVRVDAEEGRRGAGAAPGQRAAQKKKKTKKKKKKLKN